jgi:hypothetical protein
MNRPLMLCSNASPVPAAISAALPAGAATPPEHRQLIWLERGDDVPSLPDR